MITPHDSAPQAPPQMPASSFDIRAPYVTSALSPVYVGGDDDPGGRDDVAGSVAEAQANAKARFGEHQTDTYGQGSQIGDSLNLPPKTSDGSDGGGFYDPPRDY
jgi:hypothetical protein